jgi:hypothetical protein
MGSAFGAKRSGISDYHRTTNSYLHMIPTALSRIQQQTEEERYKWLPVQHRQPVPTA